MPRKKVETPQPPLAIRAVELTQRAELGGHPLGNELAASLDLGHGTPLLVVSKRDLVAFLKIVQNAAAYTGATVSPGNHFPSKERPEWVEVHGGRAGSSYYFMRELEDKVRPMLKKWDTFVFSTEEK